MIAAAVAAPRRRLPAPEPVLAGLAVCVVARAASGGAASLRAAGLFAAMGGVLAWWAGWRPARPRAGSLAWGVAGSLFLVAGPALSHAGIPPVAGVGPARVAAWVVVVAAVAASEEAVLRGSLWMALERQFGRTAALSVTTVVFAVMHVPLYGWQAVPLDLAVGLVLGGLRLITAGAAAPAVAHVLADVLGGWL